MNPILRESAILHGQKWFSSMIIVKNMYFFFTCVI